MNRYEGVPSKYLTSTGIDPEAVRRVKSLRVFEEEGEEDDVDDDAVDMDELRAAAEPYADRIGPEYMGDGGPFFERMEELHREHPDLPLDLLIEDMLHEEGR